MKIKSFFIAILTVFMLGSAVDLKAADSGIQVKGKIWLC